MIKSLDPALPVFEAAGSPVSEQRGWPDAIRKAQPSGFGPLHKFNRYGRDLAALQPAPC